MTALFILYVLCVLSDWWTTHRILKYGGRELNPIARWLMGRLGVDQALFLMCTTGILIAGTLLLKGPWYLLAAVDAVYVAVIVNNVLVLRKMGKLF